MKTLTLIFAALTLAACAPKGSPEWAASRLASGDLMLRQAFLTAPSMLSRGPYEGGIESWRMDDPAESWSQRGIDISGPDRSSRTGSTASGWGDAGKHSRLGSD